MKTKIAIKIEKLEKLLGVKLNDLNSTDVSTLTFLYIGKSPEYVYNLRKSLHKKLLEYKL